MKTTPKSVALLVFLFIAGGIYASDTTAGFAAPVVAGQLAEPKNREASGLAASHRTKGLLWVVNDSGGDNVVYAIDDKGAARGAVRLQGVKNTDWEDLTSFELDGKAMLLVADTGNNFSTRTPCVLHVFTEPDVARLSPGQEITLTPDYSIYFVFEDGARDCEAVTVDAVERAVYLLSKREVPAKLYRVPLQRAQREIPAAARVVGTVPQLPQPLGLQKMVPAPLFGLRGQPTAIDFAPDGRSALVLLYGGPLLFKRERNESWADALARTPVALPAFDLPQAEAACFSRDGRSIFVCSEKVLTLLRYDKKP
ncbi:hypothetical protein [Oleiharenicola lentus]|uniref:hypothetical protein n=1 Tax=Oleiharenicola lentus TaxID=2508720 RepID=UPI003F66E3C8